MLRQVRERARHFLCVCVCGLNDAKRLTVVLKCLALGHSHY